MDQHIFAIEGFFVSVLRWLQRLATRVVALRPLICNALLGRYSDPSGPTDAVQLPGEMMIPNSMVAHILKRHSLSHRGICSLIY